MLYSVWYFLYTRFFFLKAPAKDWNKVKQSFFSNVIYTKGFEFGDNYSENVTRWYSVVRSGALSKPYSRKNIDLLWSKTLLQSRPFARKWSEAETNYPVRIGRPVTWMRQNKIALFFMFFVLLLMHRDANNVFPFFIAFWVFSFLHDFFFYAVWLKTRLS